MLVNSNNAIQKIQASIDAVNSSTTLADLTMLAIAVDDTTVDREFYVNTANDLPNIVSANVPEGQIYYVDSLKVLVISANNQWMGIDGRVLRTDGGELTSPTSNTTIYSAGLNTCGQLGLNITSSCQVSPSQIYDGSDNWTQISAGCRNVVALKSNGTIWTWGANDNASLGDGTTINRSSPVSVIGGFTDWCHVVSGRGSMFGIRTNGTLWGWGNNNNNGLGLGGGDATRSSPVSVLGGFTDWCQVSAGYRMGLAVRQNGTLWGWGDGQFGMLGNKSTTIQSSPVSVAGGFTDWCGVSVGYRHVLGIRSNGTIWSWGSNNRGQLGNNGPSAYLSSPVSVVGGFTNWCQVSAGKGAFSAAVRTNGTLWTWGYNSIGMLGIGLNDGINRSSPVSVVGGFTDWCQVSIGNCHMIGIRTNATVWGWGSDTSGQLATNRTVSNFNCSPVSICSSNKALWSRISAGQDFTTLLAVSTDN